MSMDEMCEFSAVHCPAVSPGTPGFRVFEYCIVGSSVDFVTHTSTTMYRRSSTDWTLTESVVRDARVDGRKSEDQKREALPR